MVSSEQYNELAEVAGGFIHDIKNHLSTLSLNLQLLAEDFSQPNPETPREKRALAKIQKLQTECDHLVEISNDFLRFARLSSLEREPCDLTEVVEELIDFFMPTAQKANIDIRAHLPADLPPVCLNRELFKQALLNLFLNAQQAMPQGGVLTIQVNLETSLAPHLVPIAPLPVTPLPPGERGNREGRAGDGKGDEGPLDTVCLYIIDTGTGMPPEVTARIFRPFFSTRQGGTGLGLATTRKIIEAHDGTIEVQSAVGRGTRFAIRLPVHRLGPAFEGDCPG